MGFELRLEFLAEHAALNARRLRHRIHLEHAVETAQVDADDPVGLRRLDAAHDAGAAAVGNGDRADFVAPGKRVAHLLLAARECDRVGRIGAGACKHARHVDEHLAVAVLEPVEVLGRDDVLERGRHVQARRAQADFLCTRRGRHIEGFDAEARRQGLFEQPDLLGGGALVGIAPAVEFSSARAHAAFLVYAGRV